jgi:hypothetical protein
MVYTEETYQLWWEYLKRSLNYKYFCAAMYAVSEFDLETKFLEMSLQIKDNLTFLKFCSLWAQYQDFGDIYHASFDDWWAKRNPEKVVEDVSKIYKKEAFFFLQHLKHFHKLPITNEAIYTKFGEYLESYPYGDYVFLKVNASASDKDIRDTVSKAVRTKKKKHTLQLDALKKYLLVYDGRKAGKSDDEIASEVFEREKTTSTEIYYMEPRKDQRGNKEPLVQKQVSDYLRDYNKFAEQIIENVEMGNFPGKFRKQEDVKKP